MRRELQIKKIQEPREGLLGEAYQAVLSMHFNSGSQSKILNHIRQVGIANPLGLAEVVVRQEREDRYVLCGGLRHYQLLRAAGVSRLTAKVFSADVCLKSIALESLRQEFTAMLAYDCTTTQLHPQLRELKKYLKNHASPELLKLINSDAFLKGALKISARDLRTQYKKKVL